jgi:hypothetical protein
LHEVGKAAQRATLPLFAACRLLQNRRGKPKSGLLALGTYKAHLVQDENHKNYKYNRRYELIYPDGEREMFSVSGETK